MTTSLEAKKFVAQHEPLDDLLGTLAARFSCAAQLLAQPRSNKEQLIESLHENTEILVEIDRQFRLEKRTTRT